MELTGARCRTDGRPSCRARRYEGCGRPPDRLVTLVFVPIQRGVKRVSARSNRLLWFGFQQFPLYPVLFRKLSQERMADDGRPSVTLSLDAGNHDKSTGSFGQEDTDSSYKHIMSKGLPLAKPPQWRLMLLTSLNGSSRAGADFFVFGVGGPKDSVFLEKRQ